MATKFDISAPVERLMSVMQTLEKLDEDERQRTTVYKQGFLVHATPGARTTVCKQGFLVHATPGAEQGLPRKQKKSVSWDTDCVKACSLMSAMNRPAVEPPHEPAGSTALQDLYGSYDFYDDVSGAPLDHGLATAARRLEIDFF